MASAPDYDSTGIEFYNIPSFTFAAGTTLHDVKIAYRSHNPGGKADKGTILIPTCYGGLINDTLSFTAAPNDRFKDHHVVVVAMLGNGESASPSNKPFFPTPGSLVYADCVRAQHLLLTSHLGVHDLEAVVGFSMGAQQAYHWAVMYPGMVKRIVAICGSARTSPHNYAFLEGPVAALTNSIDYVAWRQFKARQADGEQFKSKDWEKLRPERGLKAFGRAYCAWLTSASWWRERCWAETDRAGEKGMGFKSVEDFILGASEQSFNAWDAEDLLALARMWQLGDVGLVVPGEESKEMARLGGGTGDDEMFKKALQSIQAKVLVMPCQTDQYFPPEDSEIEMQYLKKGEFAPIESIWGHAAGGGMNEQDTVWMNERIGRFLQE